MFRTGTPPIMRCAFRRNCSCRQTAILPDFVRGDARAHGLDHSGWSDIFFLGMDLPEMARVLNVSIDLAIHEANAAGPKPPVETYLRVVDRPVIRLVSVDLDATAEIGDLQELSFDRARLSGLLKAALIASGIVPPGMEGSGQPLTAVLAQVDGREGLGIDR